MLPWCSLTRAATTSASRSGTSAMRRVSPEGPGPSWTAQEAIAVIEDKPRFVKDGAWNAEFDPYLGSWRVSLIYQVRALYPPRDERKAMIWLVYEDTGRVEGPLD